MLLKIENSTKIIFILIITIVVLIVLLYSGCNHKDTQTVYIESDSLKREINKLHQEITTTNRNYIDLINENIKLVNEFREEVKNMKNKSSVTYFSTNTPIVLSTKPIRFHDYITNQEIRVDSIKQFGEWITGYIKSYSDSSFVNLNVKNDYVLSIGTESNGLFKPRKFYGKLTNLNPYTNTSDLKIVAKEQPKPKKIGIGVSFSYGLTSDLKLQPCIGIGISYNLIRL